MLLKDLPTVPSGSIFTFDEESEMYVYREMDENGDEHLTVYTAEVMLQEAWFEPLNDGLYGTA